MISLVDYLIVTLCLSKGFAMPLTWTDLSGNCRSSHGNSEFVVRKPGARPGHLTML